MLAWMFHHHRADKLSSITLALIVTLALSACKSAQSFGDRDSIIVRADPALWLEVDSAVLSALERPVYTSRQETEFKVTFLADTDTLWSNLRLWKEVVVLADAEDPVARRIIKASGRPAPDPPAIVQAGEVWARGQLVTLVLLPERRKAQAVRSQLPMLSALLREQYDTWIIERMYASGPNDSLKDVLSAYGFTLDLPRVYVHGREDSTFRFRNVHPNPATRIRAILVTWERERDRERVDPQDLLAWRRAGGETLYDPPQDVLDEGIRFDTLEVGGLTALELRGVWQDRASFPAAGPFIARSITCADQGRIYFIDAWLYYPGDDKYPYLRQLEIILDTFRCSEEEPLRLSRVAARAAAAAGPAGR